MKNSPAKLALWNFSWPYLTKFFVQGFQATLGFWQVCVCSLRSLHKLQCFALASPQQHQCFCPHFVRAKNRPSGLEHLSSPRQILLSGKAVKNSKEPIWPGNFSPTEPDKRNHFCLKVVAVSTERYLAICRPLQYKPSPIFYILLVFLTSIGVNFGRFLEFRTTIFIDEDKNSSEPIFEHSELMADER